MGNSQIMSFNRNITISSNSDFMKQLYFIETHSVPSLGSVQIYRFKQQPYDYIMKQTRVFNCNNPALQTYKKIVQQVATQLTHKNIVQIHCYQINTQFHMCGRVSQVYTYCNFYSITLKEIINKRRKDDIRFTANEIWYVLKSLLQISVLLRKKKYNFQSYKSKYITLSSEGYLKLYILPLQRDFSSPQDYSDTEYMVALHNRSNISEYLPLPPQYLPSLKQGNQCFAFDNQKQDSFLIATVVLEMMIDQDIKKYYSLSSDNFCTFKKQTVLKDLNILGYVYDKNYLLPLLQNMLQYNPSSRLSPQSALQKISRFRQHINIGGSLRMFEDQQNSIKPKLSYRTSFDFENNILKALQPNILQNKLTACPINALSKRVNSKATGVTLTSSKQSTETKIQQSKKEFGLIKQYQKGHSSTNSRGSSLSTKIGATRRL